MSTAEPTPTATFRTTLWASGGNNVGIVVPEDVVLGFGRGKRVPVIVTIDGGYTYRSTIASMGGQLLLSFNAETRAATGRGAGDEIEVTLAVDDTPRVVEVPAALAEALHRDPAAAEAWARLSYSKQRAHGLSVEGAKSAETRDRRVQKVLAELSAG
ncbi:YdeI/OmpD-associated family protein [Cellulomonas sp. KRMCY2]|uniref:YdeI/OmpD-associated family protein n=1 Tax=Cellulomonas sp. KRMCY2 TaxID=1304865 RepID=UPI00045E9020|nr:YdeI/OmpD-associated family protein [Cellulomonas sp. KRMCY2]